MVRFGQAGWHKPARLEPSLTLAKLMVVKNTARLDLAILRTRHFGNIHHFARAICQARQVNHHVNHARYLHPRNRRRHGRSVRQPHHFQPVQTILQTVGIHVEQRTGITRMQRRKLNARLFMPAITHHQALRPQAQRVEEQLAYTCAVPLCMSVRTGRHQASFERNNLFLFKLQLRHVFN